MKNEKDISILDELNNRLDDFFSDELTEDNISDIFDEPVKKSSINTPRPVNCQSVKKNFDDLKAILLEMDWEINEDNLNNYLNEISLLLNCYSDDRVIYLFLKLLKSLGHYMLYKQSNANPDVLKFLYNSFGCIEKIISEKMTEYDRNLLILKETEKFKQLKSTIFPKTNNKAANNSFENVDEKKKMTFKSLPEEIQKEINDYIENEINAKINELKKRLNKIK